jgi:hypothetical protein
LEDRLEEMEKLLASGSSQGAYPRNYLEELNPASWLGAWYSLPNRRQENNALKKSGIEKSDTR